MTALSASIALVLSLAAGVASADAPTVTGARAEKIGGLWMIEVTLAHKDTGWDHYANGFEVQAPDGTRLGYRELTHPHVGEASFQWALTGLKIPDDISYVLIRPRCSLVGWSAEPVRLDLPN
jgi:hypothetical protein